MSLSREEVLGLKKGEVIEYNTEYGLSYLHVDSVDTERGVVSGHITDASGVNNRTIDSLVEEGTRVAKWQKD